MEYTVYIYQNCPTCERVLTIMQRNKVDCKVVDVEKEGRPEGFAPIYPTLYAEGTPLAYGDKIIEYLELK